MSAMTNFIRYLDSCGQALLTFPLLRNGPLPLLLKEERDAMSPWRHPPLPLQGERVGVRGKGCYPSALPEAMASRGRRSVSGAGSAAGAASLEACGSG